MPSTTTPRDVRLERHRAILELVAREPIGSQYDLAARLTAAGFPVTQATVSRDIAELGLVKLPRDGSHAYVPASQLGRAGEAPAAYEAGMSAGATAGAAHDGGDPRDDRLRRLLGDLPCTVGRSGLILVLRSSPGMANALAQAIDESSLQEQEGTLAGDDTILVLFADEARLARWHARFEAIRSSVTPASTEVLR